MLTPASSRRILVCTRPTDMRKNFDGLAAMVKALGEDPLGGSLYLFRNRRGDRLKLLYWDGEVAPKNGTTSALLKEVFDNSLFGLAVDVMVLIGLIATETCLPRRTRRARSFEFGESCQWKWSSQRPTSVTAVVDERPIDVSLPVCGMHIKDPRLKAIAGTLSGPRRLTLSVVYPKFEDAVNKMLRSRWADLTQRMNDAEAKDRRSGEGLLVETRTGLTAR